MTFRCDLLQALIQASFFFHKRFSAIVCLGCRIGGYFLFHYLGSVNDSRRLLGWLFVCFCKITQLY